MPKYAVEFLEVDSLMPNPLNTRYKSDHNKLLKLADSIKQYGVFHPLLVGDTTAGLQIISGVRRWKAAKIAGLTKLPAVVVKVNTKELLLLFMEENLQRENLSLFEQAHAIDALTGEKNMTIDSVATRLQLSHHEIKQLLSLLSLPENVRDAYEDGQLTQEELFDLAQHQDALVRIHRSKAT